MTELEFDGQLKRLRTQWPHSYGEERRIILYRALRHLSADLLVDAVTECLLKYRHAPLVDEIQSEIERARSREKERLWQDRSNGSVLGVMREAADNNKTANPDHVAACMKLLTGYIDGKYTRAQFNQGIAVLEAASGMRPMPRPSHRDAAAGEVA